MKQKLLFVSILLLCIQFTQAQNTTSDYLVRSTTGVAGSSETISANNNSYTVQQSIGQTSAIGTFSTENYTVGQGFTLKYNCDKLVYFEKFDNINQAIAREKQLKSGNRKRKEELIKKENSNWNYLSEGWVFQT